MLPVLPIHPFAVEEYQDENWFLAAIQWPPTASTEYSLNRASPNPLLLALSKAFLLSISKHSYPDYHSDPVHHSLHIPHHLRQWLFWFGDWIAVSTCARNTMIHLVSNTLTLHSCHCISLIADTTWTFPSTMRPDQHLGQQWSDHYSIVAPRALQSTCTGPGWKKLILMLEGKPLPPQIFSISTVTVS